jgi:hypothetical protein
VLVAQSVVAVSAYGTALIALAGSLLGGLIAGTVSLLVARQARDAAESAWIRDNRREIYDRFPTRAQKLLIACVAGRRDEGSEASVETAHADFFEAYGVVQTVAEARLVTVARDYAYRLLELENLVGAQDAARREHAALVANLVRRARHDTIDAMRAELGLGGSPWPAEDYNPFAETEYADTYAATRRPRDRPPARRAYP